MDALNEIQIEAENNMLKLVTGNYAFHTVAIINKLVLNLGTVGTPDDATMQQEQAFALVKLIQMTKQLRTEYQTICPGESAEALSQRIYALFG